MTDPTTPSMLKAVDTLRDSPKWHRVAVYGLGVVGRAAARFLLRRGAQVVGFDQNKSWKDKSLTSLGLQTRLGPVGEDAFDEFSVVIIGPGVDPRGPEVLRARGRGVPVVGELELVGPLPRPVVAVTGTNGKSTTTALIGAMLSAVHPDVFIGGNLGSPLIEAVGSGRRPDIYVLELSSFQLETAYRFHSQVSVITNLSSDHTDRYATFEDYVAAKANLLKHTTADDVVVANADDEAVMRMTQGTAAQRWLFSHQTHTSAGATIDGANLVMHGIESEPRTISLHHERLFGRHNMENAAAAWLACAGVGERQWQKLEQGYQQFAGLPHRLQFVASVGGVRFVNDSKATNDEAAAIGLTACEPPVVLLLGGRDKGGGYQKVAQAARGKVRTVVAFGEAAPVIAKELSTDFDVACAQDLASGFEQASKAAQSGDVVLLSPACSSFDEFKNYEERGDAFCAYVRALEAAA